MEVLFPLQRCAWVFLWDNHRREFVFPEFLSSTEKRGGGLQHCVCDTRITAYDVCSLRLLPLRAAQLCFCLRCICAYLPFLVLSLFF